MVAGNPVLLLEVVATPKGKSSASAKSRWRNAMQKAFSGVTKDTAKIDAIADQMFRFFQQKAHEAYGVKHGLTAGQALDVMEVDTPATQDEIDKAWKIESSSSEEGRRYFYGPDGHPEELIGKMVQQRKDREKGRIN